MSHTHSRVVSGMDLCLLWEKIILVKIQAPVQVHIRNRKPSACNNVTFRLWRVYTASRHFVCRVHVSSTFCVDWLVNRPRQYGKG